MDTPSSACSTITFLPGRSSLQDITTSCMNYSLIFLYNEAGTEGNKEENDEGFGGYFHPTDFDDGKFNNCMLKNQSVASSEPTVPTGS